MTESESGENNFNQVSLNSPSKKRATSIDSLKKTPKTSPSKVQKIKVSSSQTSPIISSSSQSNPNSDIVKILKGMTTFK